MSISTKVIFQSDLRRVTLSKDTSVSDLLALLRKIYEFDEEIEKSLYLSYIDDEEDEVTIASDDDLAEAFSVAGRLNASLRITASIIRAKVQEILRQRWIDRRNQWIEERRRQFCSANSCEPKKCGPSGCSPSDCARRCGPDTVGKPDVGEVCQSKTTPARLYFGLHHRAIALLNENTEESIQKAVRVLKLQSETSGSLPERYQASPLYNLACAYALLHEKESALEYLEKAIEHGWDDLEHTKVDEDLVFVREEPEFKKILIKLGEVEVEEKEPSPDPSPEPVADDAEEKEEAEEEEQTTSDSLNLERTEFDRKLKVLAEMGWSDRRSNIAALLQAKGDLVEAVEYLLNAQ